MIKLYSNCFIVIALLFSLTAFGQEKKMMKQASEMAKAMEKRKWKKVLEYTYPKMIKLAGGEKRYLQQCKEFDIQLERQEFEVEMAELSAPGEIIEHEGLLMALIPMRMTFGGPLGKLYSESSLLAISSDKGENWKFIAMAQTDFEDILKLFPNISKKLQFPQSKVYQR